jgi:hypothetical protein
MATFDEIALGEPPDDEFGAASASYSIVAYSDAGPPFPRASLVQSGIEGFDAADRRLVELCADGADLMLCLDSEVSPT